MFWDYERIKKSILQCIDSRSVFNLIDTSIYNWMSIRLVPIGNTDSKAYCFIKFHKKNNTDITNSEDNTLTGLLSSQAFTQKVMNMIKNTDCEYSLICLDIEHFKMFNEWYGHNVGDILLSDIGSVLKSIDEEIGSISGYFGADNFAILVPNDKKNIDEITTNLMLYIEGHNQSSGFLPAFGIIEIKNKDLDFSQLYDRAVIAKTHAKGNYTNRICYFNEEMLIQMENEHLIHIDVQRALKDEEFTFYLQPQCNMSTGKIFAAEALVRWFHKDKGMVPPYKFIPVLEKSGGISELDKYIWNKVAKWQRSVIDRGITPVPVSVNVSRADLYYMDIVEYFISLVEKYEISPALIEIEITESVYIDGYDKLQGIVDKLRDYGFKVLMDDFGSGYSSLNMLKNISIDTLKLDMKFLDLNAKNNEKGINILESVVNMIKTMNLPIITEGVENDMQRCALLDMGCLYAQGYLFYKPMSISDFESLLVNSELTDYTGIQIKRVEQLQLREILNENIYSDTLVNNILGAVAFFDYHDGKVEISHINEGYYRLFGNVCMNDPNYRTNIMDYFVLDDHQAIKEGFEYAYHNVLRGANVELRYKHEDGIIWVHARLFYLNKETKPGHRLYYCSFVNVTSKYDAENQLYLLNKKLKTTIKLENINSWEINFANNSLILFTCEENGPLSGMVPTDTNQKRIVLPFPECVLDNDLIPDK